MIVEMKEGEMNLSSNKFRVLGINPKYYLNDKLSREEF